MARRVVKLATNVCVTNNDHSDPSFQLQQPCSVCRLTLLLYQSSENISSNFTMRALPAVCATVMMTTLR